MCVMENYIKNWAPKCYLIKNSTKPPVLLKNESIGTPNIVNFKSLSLSLSNLFNFNFKPLQSLLAQPEEK